MAAAATGAREVVETLLPLTRPVSSIGDWSVVGVMDAAGPAMDRLSLEESPPETGRYPLGALASRVTMSPS